MHLSSALTILLGTVTVAITAPRAAAAVGDEGNKLSDKLHFAGRWDLRKADRAITINSGSSVRALFDGTAVAARFDPSANKAPLPTIAWRIDDGEWQEAEIADTVELAKGLKEGEHALWLVARGMDEHQVRWSPPLTASITFRGLDVPGGAGKVLDPPPEWAKPKVKIEVLGDSITEGVVVHPPREGKATWPWRTDGRVAYPFQLAERLGADLRQVGFGGQGLTHGGNGGTPPAGDTFSFFYKDCPRDDWQPDLVLINQGTNDGGAKSEKFRPLYANYLTEIRAAYPHAKIFALQPFNRAHADDIGAEVRARNDAGDPNVFLLKTAGSLERGDFTDGLHPNERGSAKAAEQLADWLRPFLPADKRS